MQLAGVRAGGMLTIVDNSLQGVGEMFLLMMHHIQRAKSSAVTRVPRTSASATTRRDRQLMPNPWRTACLMASELPSSISE